MARRKMVNFAEIKEDRLWALVVSERMKDMNDETKWISHVEAWSDSNKKGNNKRNNGRT